MSKHVRIAMILGLSVLAGCTGLKPQFQECGGKNCRREGGPDLERAEILVRPEASVAIG